MSTSIGKSKALFGQRSLVLFVLVIVLLAFLGCRANPSATASPTPQATPRPEPLPSPTPRTELSASKSPTITSVLSFIGEVRPREQVALSAKSAGRIAELKVGVGNPVRKNDLLVVLEHKALDAQVMQAEATLAAVEATLKGVQAQLDLLLSGATKEQIAAAEATVRGTEANLALLQAGATKEQIAAAEATLLAAQARLGLLLAGPKPEQLRIAEFEVEMAEQDVAVTIYKTSAYSSTNPGLLEAYTLLRLEEIKSARQEVEMAKYQLELLKAPPKLEEVTQLKAAVEGARAQLEGLKAPPRPQQVSQLEATIAGAKAQLEALKAPPRSPQVAQLEAGIEGAKAQRALAQASLSLAKAQNEEAFLYAPFDGSVSSRSLGIGSLASPGAIILTLASKEVEVVIAVDEIVLRQVSPGQVVSFAVPANPDQTFTGKVRTIAPVASSVTRTFDVYIDPQDPTELLRPGMFATVSLLKGEGL